MNQRSRLQRGFGRLPDPEDGQDDTPKTLPTQRRIVQGLGSSPWLRLTSRARGLISRIEMKITEYKKRLP